MAINYRMALTLLCGLTIGGAIVQAVHAQSKTAYLVIAIRSITDEQTYKTVTEKGPALVRQTGGRPIVATSDVTGLDGPSPKRFVLIAFDSVEKAKAWTEMPAVKELTDMRKKSTDSLSFIVEGVPN
jgi:uncharacterized protein (DUF1330 family)